MSLHFSSRPDRVFVSVDERTGRSTISFFPAQVCAPLVIEDDSTGDRAMDEARGIVAKYPGCTIAGPHFHRSTEGRRRQRRRPPT